MSVKVNEQNTSQLVELVVKSQESLDKTLKELSKSIADNSKSVASTRSKMNSGVEVPKRVLPPEPVALPAVKEVVKSVPKPVETGMVSKGASEAKTPAFHWLLDGAGDEDGLYIQRVIDGDTKLKLDELMDNLPNTIEISRATMGRLTKEIRDGKYDSYIAEYTEKQGKLSVNDIYSYPVSVERTANGKGWKIKKGK